MSHSRTFRHGSNRHSPRRRDSRSPDRQRQRSPSRHRLSSRHALGRSPSPPPRQQRTASRTSTDASDSRPVSAIRSVNSHTPTTPEAKADAADDAESLKKMSMKERLAMWKKRKEEAKSSLEQTPAERIAEDVRTVSRASSAADDGSSAVFVTAPGSAVSQSQPTSEAGFESLPVTPGPNTAPLAKSALKLDTGIPVGAASLGGGIRSKPLGGPMKMKLGRPGLGVRRLQLLSALGRGVFGADADADGQNEGSGDASQRRRPLVTLLAEEHVSQPNADPMKAMDVDDPAADPLEEYMQGVTSEVNGNHSQLDRALSADPAIASNGTGAQTLAGDEGNFSDRAPEDSEDVLALAARRLKKKELPIVDHSKITYESFKRNFYIEPAELRDMTKEEVDMMRVDLGGIKIRGENPPKPATNWSHFGLPSACADIIRHQGFEKPTPIQAQAVPVILSGRDMIGVAKTGSGKTLAFILPMLRHIKAQRPLAQGEGPIALVMTPTRELAVQIHRECKPFLKPLGLRAVCAYGGSAIKDQIGELKRGAEIVVCTPGRMIDLLSANSGRVTNLHRVTYLVLDEADRMFDMGFEPQVSKITQSVRPSRQTVLFSATFPRQMEALARKILRRPLEIVIGGRALIPPEVAQHVEVVEAKDKFIRLLGILGQTFNDNGESLVIIFVDRQEAADGLLRDLMRRGYVCNSLHGGKDQTDRDQAISDFKNRVYSVLIATSVAARGLDVRGLNVVINFDCPNHMEDLVHRVGRTGRAGNKGDAYTFITPDQDRYASEVVKALKLSGLTPPDDVQAMADAFIENVRQGKERHGGKSGFGGKGLEKLDKDRNMVKKIQKITYGAADGETLDDDDDDEDGEAGNQGEADSDGESTIGPGKHRAKGKDGEVVRRLPATSRSTTAAAASPVVASANSGSEVTSTNEALQQPALPEGLPAAARAALLAAQAAARRLNIASSVASDPQSAPVLSAVEQINQQLGITTATPGHTDAPLSAAATTAAAVTTATAPKMRASNSSLTKDPASSKDSSTPGHAPASGANASIPVGAYGCELDINDYPQKARWRATNRETLSQIIEQSGAAITTRGIFVPPGKPVPEGERKLYLSIESDSERSVEQAKNEIKRILTEATLHIMEQEARAGGTSGRYSVV
ncbi:pre-mRNA processing RNA-helicase [Kickxella alabastrina]|uniref:Pre-mRNA processing RNA-helicase n=1 Tax=Kickxella alabastrina TaxID=61397 RepID=A0ACC1IV73_9FUNG|nr:pre-mRNA processing RNA-helicase [Kickxella alabastrina]